MALVTVAASVALVTVAASVALVTVAAIVAGANGVDPRRLSP